MSSNPAHGSSLEKAPAEIRLVFSEKPAISLASVRLVGNGHSIRLTPLRVDPQNDHMIIAPVASRLAPAAYRILWTVAGADGHPIRGEVGFVVRDAEAADSEDTVPPAPVLPPAAEDDLRPAAFGGAIASILARWLAFASLFVIVGAVAFRFFLLPRIGASESDSFTLVAATNAATAGFAGAIVLILTSLVKLARESSDMPDIAISSMLFSSTWGLSLALQILAAIIAAAAFRLAHGSGSSSPSGAWRAALVAAVVLSVTPALGGHAVGGHTAYLGVPADVFHVLAGSIWIGTLAVIVIVGIPAALKSPDSVRPGARVAALINAFSPIALMCGGVVVATGLGSSVIRLPRIDALWTTPYGVVLVIKLCFVGLLFGAGAWNWRRMKPRLTGDNQIGPLRSSARLELVIAAAVLAITAVLVAVEVP